MIFDALKGRLLLVLLLSVLLLWLLMVTLHHMQLSCIDCMLNDPGFMAQTPSPQKHANPFALFSSVQAHM